MAIFDFCKKTISELRRRLGLSLDYFKAFFLFVRDSMSSVFLVITLLMLLSSTVIVILFTILQVDYIVDGKFSSFKDYGDFILRVFRVAASDVDAQKYSSILSTFIGSFSVLVTIWFAFAGIYYAIKKSKIKSIEVRTVQEDEHDLKIMLPYYKKARDIVVYAGSFDWVRKNEALQAIVKNLAQEGKIRMISDKTEDKVKIGLGDELFNILKDCIEYDGMRKDIRCSFLSNGSYKIVLYKEAGATLHETNGKPNIVVIKNSDSTSYLLSVLDKLISKNGS